MRRQTATMLRRGWSPLAQVRQHREDPAVVVGRGGERQLAKMRSWRPGLYVSPLLQILAIYVATSFAAGLHRGCAGRDAPSR